MENGTELLPCFKKTALNVVKIHSLKKKKNNRRSVYKNVFSQILFRENETAIIFTA